MKQFRLLNLKLQTKTTLYFLIGLLGVTLSCLYITRYFFLVSLDNLENVESTRASEQAYNLINNMVEELEGRSYDWAYWDETHTLLLDGSVKEYRERNLLEGSLDSLSLDMMIFTTLRGEVIESVTHQQEDDNRFVNNVMSEPAIRHHVQAMNKVMDSFRESYSGLVALDEQLWSVSLTPVRNSDGSAASSGWLLWGQNLSLRFPGNFESILIAQSEIFHIGQPHQLSLIPEIDKSRHYMSRTVDLVGMSGTPVAHLKTTLERVHFLKGNVLFSYLFMAVAFVAIVITTITFLLFRRRVAVRFSDLEKDIDQLFSSYQLEGLNQPNKDELDRLVKLVQALASDSSTTKEMLQDTQQKFEALYESQTIAMVLVRGREIVDINKTALGLLGYERDELIHQPLDLLCEDSQQPECQIDAMYRMFQQGQTQFEAQMLTKEGENIDCQIEVRSIRYQGNVAMMLSIRDVRVHKQQVKLIEDLAERDHLSGLWNRKAIMEKARGLVQSQPNQFALIYISIPNLMQVSEVYGHQIFDQSLESIACLFGTELSLFPVGRISSHEFLVLIEHESDCQIAEQGAVQFKEALSRKRQIQTLMLDLKCQIALIEPEITHHSLDMLIHSSIHALEVTRNSAAPAELTRVGCSTLELAQAAAAIKRDLESAIESKEIHAHYQPIVDSKTAEIVGFEALARWQHPQFGFVSPAVFIPLAERDHQIIKLGESILEQACEFMTQVDKIRRSQGKTSLTIHVNLSAAHFYYPGLPDYLVHIIQRYNVLPGQLVIEVTESMLMGIEDEVIARMELIKSLGVLFALDDFGTGYSSFSTLCCFPLDIVKLDKSYIDQLEVNDRAKSLVRNIANMAQELGLTTVAEGVETASQARKLKNWNIEEIQGFYFYKPMPEGELIKLITGVNG
ncbi:sensory box/GGDEF family protein [Vibrio orientalis CIP 102891 = ATCC 33934]|uniref:GGDEF family protein n=1 Tax=Vibrio orientalis CIP 102891 = ATCC 33934 TaxID=675816 RepID=C9QHS8_VIBOR|nr:EAL domain-containing protein [Vibrio orientalis]EEX92249.1 GGDEF family protein [Vibrio orientalis CIP 102891 = ATCC 33934]EGU53240.1 sensory box/GGDEF family protein [Vibrio orientalis CIP 102891 = ATCC 33934]